MPMFDSIAVGNQVVISNLCGQQRIATVERVTARQFVADGIRFTKHGDKVGEPRSAWRNTRAYIATPELIEHFQQRNGYMKAKADCLRERNILQARLNEIDRSSGNYAAKALALDATLSHIQAACAELERLLPHDDA